MCDPTGGIALSLGAMIAGQMMKSGDAASNQASAINAKNASTARTIAAEQDLQKKSSGIFDQTLTPYQGAGPEQALTSAQGANTSAISANGPSAASLAGGATTGNAPKVVQDSENSTIASRVAKLRSSDAALGSLTGYDSMNGANARTLTDAKSNIGTIGTFANDQATVGAARTEADVANSQKAPSPFADLLSGAGQLGSMYAGAHGSLDGLFAKKPTPLQLGLY